MITCGADGTVRLWGLKQTLKAEGHISNKPGEGEGSVLLAKRAFSSAQTCLAVAPVSLNTEYSLAGVSEGVCVCV